VQPGLFRWLPTDERQLPLDRSDHLGVVNSHATFLHAFSSHGGSLTGGGCDSTEQSRRVWNKRALGIYRRRGDHPNKPMMHIAYSFYFIKNVKFLHYFRKIYKFPHIFVQFTFLWLNLCLFVSPLFWPCCIYASCFTHTGRPCIGVNPWGSWQVMTPKILGWMGRGGVVGYPWNITMSYNVQEYHRI